MGYTAGICVDLVTPIDCFCGDDDDPKFQRFEYELEKPGHDFHMLVPNWAK